MILLFPLGLLGAAILIDRRRSADAHFGYDSLDARRDWESAKKIYNEVSADGPRWRAPIRKSGWFYLVPKDGYLALEDGAFLTAGEAYYLYEYTEDGPYRYPEPLLVPVGAGGLVGHYQLVDHDGTVEWRWDDEGSGDMTLMDRGAAVDGDPNATIRAGYPVQGNAQRGPRAR
jgi:hypothetical protein